MNKTTLRFWGVRGSIPSPGPQTAQIGGNTSCLEVLCGKTRLIFDAGTGIRLLGQKIMAEGGKKTLHLFLSHYHLDHVIGIPFFTPLYQKDVRLNIYGPKGYVRSVDEILGHLFSSEFFPVPLTDVASRITYYPVGSDTILVKPFVVRSFYVNHPGKTLGYVAEISGKRLAYLPDHESIHKFCHLSRSLKKFYSSALIENLYGADILVHDAQFTDKDYPTYCGWGHSSWDDALDLAIKAHIKTLVFFHHAPQNTDVFLKKNFAVFCKKLRSKKIKIILAHEGMHLSL
ncbi:MAG: hypothetical protein A2048_03930 [Deltaproteobacteria bacterium GWA2_45_12]|nr:MAG: hypothetical protein A2048_03930 [Deltaproteobacteria bacterium GWA2_45_12]